MSILSGRDTLWYLMRGSGLVAFALLSVTVILGLLDAARWQRGRWSRVVVGVVHRNASLLAIVFVAIHVLTAVTDRYVAIPWFAAIVPGTSGYRPVWVAAGAVVLDLVVALVVTSLLRGRIGRRAWRAVHWLAYGTWPTALIHALGSGTDTGRLWTTVLYVAAGAGVAGATAVRLVRRRRRQLTARPAADRLWAT